MWTKHSDKFYFSPNQVFEISIGWLQQLPTYGRTWWPLKQVTLGHVSLNLWGESTKKFSSLQFSNFGTFHGSMMQKKFFCYLLVKKLPLIQPSFRSIDQLTFNGELIIYYAASYANHPLQVLSDEVKFLLICSNKSDLFIHPQENWICHLWNVSET